MVLGVVVCVCVCVCVRGRREVNGCDRVSREDLLTMIILIFNGKVFDTLAGSDHSCHGPNNIYNFG